MSPSFEQVCVLVESGSVLAFTLSEHNVLCDHLENLIVVHSKQQELFNNCCDVKQLNVLANAKTKLEQENDKSLNLIMAMKDAVWQWFNVSEQIVKRQAPITLIFDTKLKVLVE